ncbi:plasmodesmata-located protein 6-like [Silene latifolia]|uniref:plasmodesmata-located protein 6-like n=1 Tax=Silene latifolia TaxID=37657 RepID=UPI003D78B29F
MTSPTPSLPLSSLLILLLFSLFHVSLTASTSPTTYIYGGCSHIKYSQNSAYSASLNSLLTSLVNSATNSPFSKLTLTSPATISGVYQCRGDLPESSCSTCIRNSVSQLGSLCVNSVGGVLQLDGCFLKYDNATFLGVEDKSVVLKRCGGGGGGGDSGELVSRRDQVLGYLASLSESYYRVGESGGVKGVGQCVGDLSLGECQDCLVYAIQRFKGDCGPVGSGDLFLGKCYVRVMVDGHGSSWYGSNGSSQDDEIERTLAILVGLIAGIALLIVFFAFLRRLCDGKDGK